MKRYETSTPRVAFGIAAVAMTALTFGMSVVAPLGASSGSREIGTLAAGSAVAPAAIEVAITPARIDVVAEREQKTVFGVVRHPAPKNGRES